jgi:acyl-CoA synthetase (NDP forming)
MAVAVRKVTGRRLVYHSTSFRSACSSEGADFGARTDRQYDPFLMVGLGGIFVEVLKDVSIRLLPVDEREARGMLKELRGYKVLQGVRGQAPRDIDALVKAMVGLSDIFAAQRNTLSDFEINPLMVRAKGSGVAAVDVRLVRK